MADSYTDLASNTILGNTIAAVSATAATTTGSTVDLVSAGPNMITAFLDVVAVNAAGTLSVQIQYSKDGLSWANQIVDGPNSGLFPNVTGAVGGQLLSFQGNGRYYRAVATIGSSGNYTFTVYFLADRKTTPQGSGGFVIEQGAS